ncbi:MAG: 30S ribosome-binding factor RbfA [Dehalococcoidia bacterium]|nr:30S ribosome-binding factor RbfA [Dehalococcoidia bacterium]
MSRRTERVSDLIRREVGDILLHHIKDPRVQGLVSVIEVETSPDLKHARIFVSLFGADDERQETTKGLDAATGYIRRELSERLSLRYVPQLAFRVDDSMERGARIMQLLKEVTPEEEKEQ